MRRKPRMPGAQGAGSPLAPRQVLAEDFSLLIRSPRRTRPRRRELAPSVLH